ncbi:MAG: MarR family transcriptional regulator [Candidatus Woesearchaeota archaeon]
MNQKQISIIIIIFGILLGIFVYYSKIREDKNINQIIMAQGGSCYLPDGTCLHEDRDYTIYILGSVLSSVLILLGIYLLVFDKTQQMLVKQHLEVSRALREAKKNEKSKDEFNAFLSGFTNDEQKVLKAIREQDGIQQSTLRFRTGMSKASLSLLLKSLEERQIISRKASGKTNNVYLRKKF